MKIILKVYKLVVFFALSWILVGCKASEVRLEELRHLGVSDVPPGKVHWRSWSNRDSAKVLGHPLLLFLYTRRSYWCRQMISRCFEDQALVNEVTQGVFPIRVDADHRPDLAERFGMGGWPSTVFLTPEGDWISGSTYMDPEDFLDIVQRVKVYFEYPDRRADLERQRKYLEQRMIKKPKMLSSEFLFPSPDLLKTVVNNVQAAILQDFNPGFEALMMLLEYSHFSMDPDAGKAALLILDRIASRLLTDSGDMIFKFPLTLDGVLVDPEVNLALNAGLLAAFSRAARQKNRPEYRKIARTLGEALLESFYSPLDSLFFAGKAGFKEAISHNKEYGYPIDTTFFTSWNALTSTAFVEMYLTFGDNRYLEVSRGVLGALVQQSMRLDGAFLHVVGSAQDNPIFLEDQALVARARLDLFEVQHRSEDLQIALDICDRMVEQFAHQSGALCDSAQADLKITPAFDRWLPSGNGVAVQVLLRLQKLTDRNSYRKKAEKILTALLGPSLHQTASQGALGRGLLLYFYSETSPELL